MEKAFTLIELLIIALIILLLSAVILPGYKLGQSQFALQRAAQKLAQEIRMAQEMAMSLKELPGGEVPPGGYGIYFNQYTLAGKINYDVYLYADLNGNERYSRGEEIKTIYKEDQKIFLEKEVKIKQVSVNGVSPDKISINFKPPDPTVRLRSGQGTDYQNLIIILALKSDETKTKIIKANRAGLIYVE